MPIAGSDHSTQLSDCGAFQRHPHQLSLRARRQLEGKCNPRSTPLRERQWWSCTKTTSWRADPLKAFWLKLSLKNPRASPNTSGSRMSTPSMAAVITFKAGSQWSAGNASRTTGSEAR